MGGVIGAVIIGTLVIRGRRKRKQPPAARVQTPASGAPGGGPPGGGQKTKEPPPSGSGVKPVAPVVIKQPPERQDAATLWLEANPGSIRVRGDGKQMVTVQVHAYRNDKGARRDVTAQVAIMPAPGAPGQLLVAGGPDFQVRAWHVGSQPSDTQIVFTGQHRSEPLAPCQCVVNVHLEPVPAELRVVAAKAGFNHQAAVESLSVACGEVRGRLWACDPTPQGFAGPSLASFVEADAAAGPAFAGQASFAGGAPLAPLGGNLVERPAQDGRQPVAFAHCLGSLRIDNGPWSAGAEVISTMDGSFPV